VEDDARHFLKHPIDRAHMEVHMPVQAGAEEVDKGDCANVQGCLVQLRRPRAVGLQTLRNDAQEDAQHHVQYRSITLHEVAQALWDRQHPLAHRQAGKDVVSEVRRRLHHAPGIARGAHAAAFAGIGDKIVVPAVVTPRPGKAVGEDAALQIFAKSLADIGLGRVVVAKAIELTGTGQLKPGLKMFGYGAVKQRPLGVARVVKFGFGTRLPTRMRMRLHWACSGGHGAVPAWAGCLIILGLYPALWFSLLSAVSLLLLN
jgi:hypothetical protein